MGIWLTLKSQTLESFIYKRTKGFLAWLVELDEEGVDRNVLQMPPALGDEVTLHGVQGEHQTPRLVHPL